VLATVARSSEEAARAMAADHGGQVSLAQDYAEVYGARHTLIERCWNHTTLHAKAQDETLTYIECIYAPHDYVERAVEMRDRFAGELLQHVELMRLDGALTAVGIPLVRYRDAERLEAIMQAHRDSGIYINNPHTYVLGDGGKLTSESRSLAMKRRLDPAGLLNPGKVRPLAA
jgi:FAD/FMN-containing dehydrogenase